MIFYRKIHEFSLGLPQKLVKVILQTIMTKKIVFSV